MSLDNSRALPPVSPKVAGGQDDTLDLIRVQSCMH